MNSIDQINQLIDLLLDIDEVENPSPEQKKELYSLTLQMINNPDIYGDVLLIVQSIHNEIQDDFNVDIPFSDYAFKLVEYLPIE